MATIHRIAVSLSAWVLSTVLLALLSPIRLPAEARAQAAAGHGAERAAALSGLVVDASGKPVSGAQVSLEPADGSKAVLSESDVSGRFRVQALVPGRYTIHASYLASESDRSSLVVTLNPQQDIRIILRPVHGSAPANANAAAGASMEFVDKPAFTVAGVTDWTAVGGHGSDATLRTSEELNRQALALRAQTPADAPAGKAGGDIAEKRLLAAVSASPQSYEANRDLGLFYLHGARFTLAVTPLEAASRIHGGKADDEYSLALACRGSGDFATAREHIKRALAQGETAESHRLAAEVEEQLGNPLGAVTEDQRAAQLDPSESNYFAWGTELLLHRAIWQAADVFSRAATAYPGSVRVKTAWGAALYAGALYDEAAEKICEASDLDPAAREPYVFAGRIAMASPSTSSCAGQKLERFLTLRPNDAEANYFYAMFLLKQGAVFPQERPRELLLRAVELDPKCSDGFVQLGILAAAKRDYKAAIAYYRKALEADPQQGEAHFRLAIAYDRTGEPDKAKTEYRLHEQIDAANAASVDQQRREVKQFSIVTDNPPAEAPAR